MMGSRQREVSALLADWSNGNEAARDELMPLVYDELRRLAGHYMALERKDHSLQPPRWSTRCISVSWINGRCACRAAPLLRYGFLDDPPHSVDYARRAHYAKRGGAARRVSLDEAMIVSKEKAADVVVLDDALTRLAAIDLRKSQVVELRYFGGLSMDEIAKVLQVSEVTVRRDWSTAKAWLYRAIGGTNKASANGR